MNTSDPSLLAAPVALSMRPTPSVDGSESLKAAGLILRDGGYGAIPVLDGRRVAGVITEASLLPALAEADLQAPCTLAMRRSPTLGLNETGAQALRLFETTGAAALPVVDANGNLAGMLAPSDLIPRGKTSHRPTVVGGMATPFGVYLTTGSVRAGAGDLGLVATGATLLALLVVAQLAGNWVTQHITVTSTPSWLVDFWLGAIPLVFFLLGMRAIPLAGVHGAEHQVVHAIERGEDLVPDIVRRMPRVHPRCGTNIAAGLCLFLGVSSMEVIPTQEIRVITALLVTLALWKPLGSFLQLYITTRRPSDKHIASGIRAGEQLLSRYQRVRFVRPTVATRIWNSGLIHVIIGSFLAFFAIDLVSRLLGIDLGLRVY